MILNYQQIIEAVNNGEIEIQDFDESCVESASYDLRMGGQAVSASSKKIINVKDVGFVTVEPGDFAIVIVHEKISMDNIHVGRFGLKSKYSRKGLIATIGPQIDAGYKGKLIVGLTNLSPSPIVIGHKDRLFTVEFHRLEEETQKPYRGPYQEKDRIEGDEVEEIINSNRMTMPEMYTTLQSLSKNVEGLTLSVKSLLRIVPLGIGFLAVIITILGVIIALKP